MIRCRWLSSVDVRNLSFVQERFLVQPTIGHDLTPLNSLESKARKKLETYGINASMLIENVAISSKSSIIGIYRIMVNRFQLDSIAESDNKRTELFGSDKKYTRRNSIKNVSKTCTLLWEQRTTTKERVQNVALMYQKIVSIYV